MSKTHRLTSKQTDVLIQHLPSHRWYKKTLKELLSHKVVVENVPSIPLNEELLESLIKYGFKAPMLVMDSWYPICGSQRLRAAIELPESVLESTVIDVMKLDNSVWTPFYFWADKKEGHRCSQILIQQLELVFKSAYMSPEHIGGINPIHFEVEGDKLHWEARDGKK